MTPPHSDGTDAPADGRAEVWCPYCGERVEIHLEPDVRGVLVQDCEVCCQPWEVRVDGPAEERRVTVTRADGVE